MRLVVWRSCVYLFYREWRYGGLHHAWHRSFTYWRWRALRRRIQRAEAKT